MASVSQYDLEDEQSTIDSQEPKSPCIQPDLGFLNSNYQVLSKLGEGGFGAVFDLMDRNHRVMALKVQKKTDNGLSELHKEFNMYQTLIKQNLSRTDIPGIPSVETYMEHKGMEYMFMERLGESLSDIKFKSPSKKLSKSDVLMIGIQCVQRIRTLHENKILHRDIKPSNLIMGIGPQKERMVHIVDFGISSIVENWETYDYGEEVRFIGTLQFAAPDTLFRKAPNRKGDLMSLAYTLISLVSGNLPWVYLNTERERWLTEIELGVQRVRWKPEALCEGFPELTKFFKTIKRTKLESEPQYDHLIELLEEALEEMGSRNDGNFTWLKTTPAVIRDPPSPSTEYGPNENAESYEVFNESVGLFGESEEYVLAQGYATINALPWPPPPQREIRGGMVDCGSQHDVVRDERIIKERPATNRKRNNSSGQRETLIEEFLKLRNQVLELKTSSMNIERHIDRNIILNRVESNFTCPGMENQRRESERNVATPPSKIPDNSPMLPEHCSTVVDSSMRCLMVYFGVVLLCIYAKTES